MYSIYLQIYIIFLALVSLFLLAGALLPRKVARYSAKNGYAPRTLVIMPCKGFDIGLSDNLNAVKGQSYRNYDVVAVVASKSDSALGAIRSTRTKFIMSSSFKCRGCSAKVRSLACALAKFRDYDTYVIVDSDVLVGRDWLKLLIAPLSDKRIGISTAFPVFEPVNSGFWVRVKQAWGFVGQGLMESERTRFGWGGSLAFRKNLLSKADFWYFAGSISDDIALTRIAKRKHLRIAYVPEANPIVRSDEDFSKFMEWSNRQTTLFVAGARNVLYYAIAYYSLSILLLVSALVLGAAVNALFLVLLLPFVVGAIKLYIRSGKTYMLGMYFIMDFVYLYNMLSAGRAKQIKWRGIVYDIRKINSAADV